MKKVMALLTLLGFISVFLFGKEVKKTVEDGASCSTTEIKQDMDQEQDKCDRVRDDPYEDLICERSELKRRREAKKLKECKESGRAIEDNQ